MCKVKVNWDEIKPCDNENKVYLEHLPLYRGGIYWKKCVGKIVPILYDGIEYNILIKQYLGGKYQDMIIDIEGFNEINFKTNGSLIKNCHFARLINNIIANPNYNYLIKFCKNEEDAKTLTFCNAVKRTYVCPLCGQEKDTSMSVIKHYGFSCPYCSDNISYGEKVMASILKALGINFKKQLKFNDYGEYYYDFYLIDYDIIIEVHGEQHYEKFHRHPSWKSYEEEHENDLIKYDIVVLNGYEYNKSYFIIDAKYSNIDYIKQSIYNCSFFQQFNLDSIDWIFVAEQAEKSDVIKVWELWNNRQKFQQTGYIAEVLGISKQTVKKYLKRGNEIGKVVYDPQEELRLSGVIRSENSGEAVVGVNIKTGEVIEFSKASKAEKYGFGQTSIRACCNGKRKTHKGYQWYFKKDYDKGIRIDLPKDYKEGTSENRVMVAINIKTNEVIILPTLESTEFNRNVARQACTNKYKHGKVIDNIYKGHKWYYEEDYLKLQNELNELN